MSRVPPGATPEMVSGIMSQQGPEVMKNFLANVAQNRTIPHATKVAQTAFDEIAAEEVMKIIEEHPAMVSRLFGAQSENPPGVNEMLRMGGQTPAGRNLLTELAETLHSGDTESSFALSGLVRQRLRASGQDPEFVHDMSQGLEMASTADQLGLPNIRNPLYSLMNILDAVDANENFRHAESVSSGTARSSAERWERDLMGNSENADPLIQVYEHLEEAGVPAEEIFRGLARRLHAFDTTPDFYGEGNLAGFMDSDAVARDMIDATPIPKEGGIPEFPDINIFMRSLGLRP